MCAKPPNWWSCLISLYSLDDLECASFLQSSCYQIYNQSALVLASKSEASSWAFKRPVTVFHTHTLTYIYPIICHLRHHATGRLFLTTVQHLSNTTRPHQQLLKVLGFAVHLKRLCGPLPLPASSVHLDSSTIQTPSQHHSLTAGLCDAKCCLLCPLPAPWKSCWGRITANIRKSGAAQQAPQEHSATQLWEVYAFCHETVCKKMWCILFSCTAITCHNVISWRELEVGSEHNKNFPEALKFLGAEPKPSALSCRRTRGLTGPE